MELAWSKKKDIVITTLGYLCSEIILVKVSCIEQMNTLSHEYLDCCYADIAVPLSPGIKRSPKGWLLIAPMELCQLWCLHCMTHDWANEAVQVNVISWFQGILGTTNSGKSALVHRYLTGSYMQEESPEGKARILWLSIIWCGCVDGLILGLIIRRGSVQEGDHAGRPELPAVDQRRRRTSWDAGEHLICGFMINEENLLKVIFVAVHALGGCRDLRLQSGERAQLQCHLQLLCQDGPLQEHLRSPHHPGGHSR